MPTITLTPDDLAVAFHLATDRLIESLRNGRRDSVWVKDNVIDEWTPHCLGACGEIAVSKMLWVYPRFGVKQFSGGESDLRMAPSGLELEIRARSKPHYELKITKRDRPERAYVLVRGVPPVLDVAGWCFGYDGMRTEYLRDYGNRGVEAYFVPDNVLRPMEELGR